MGLSSNLSYRQILKSSSIIAASQVVSYGLGFVRLKALAVILGPAGVGLFGYLQTASSLMGTLTSLGVPASGVRDVAASAATGDVVKIARTVGTLRRVCWFTGIAGILAAAVVAWPLSVWSFGDSRQAWAIAALGLALFFSSIAAGQTALVQGLRRIRDVAAITVAGAAMGTLAAVALYLWLGESGIAPSFVGGAALSLVASWWFSRRVVVSEAEMSWSETWKHARSLLRLGLAFAWSGVLVALVALVTRSLIIQDLGIEANGLYQAAWSISGLFAGFVLGAMGADFYPRLTAVAEAQGEAGRLVNEQTEMGLLLALPGLAFTLAFGSEVLVALFSTEFAEADNLLPWLVIGVFGRVVSWPLGYLILARGWASRYLFTETATSAVYLASLVVMLNQFKLVGAAVAFAVMYGFYTCLVYYVARKAVGFAWSRRAAIYMIVCVGGCTASVVTEGLSSCLKIIGGSVVVALCTIYSAIELFKLIANKRDAVTAVPV